MRQLGQVRMVFRLKSFDTSTAEGVSKERYRRILLTSLTSILSKALSLLTTLISVPLTVNYLGAERFGLWMTISSCVAFLTFADFGIGNGLLNGIAEANGRDDERLARKYVSSSFFMMSGIGALVVVVFGLLYPLISWPRLFNVSSILAMREAGPALAVFVCCFAAQLPLGIVQRVQLGYQEGFISNVWQIAGNLMGLMGVLMAVRFKAGLPWLVLGMAGMPVLVTLINWLCYFRISRPALRPRMDYFEWNTGKGLAKVGFVFVLLNVFALNWFQTDNLVIAQMLGASSVAGYAVVQRLFAVTLAAQFFIVSLWPAYGEAIARSDYSWARRTLNRALFYSVLLTIAVSLPVLFFGKQIVIVWLKSDYAPSFLLMLGFAVLNLLMNVAGNLSALLVHGANLGRQLFFYGAASIAALLLKVAFTSKWGVTGVVWGTVIGFGLFYTPAALRLAYQTVNGSRKN